jgi:ubiquitin carboxyl-terminal hydrolase L3|tara:strand:+ start:341 stop:1057 length:717 start_codon:yes stop_codon:yes gene_type:complete
MATKGASKKWLPLESNPEVIAKFAHTLGLPADIGFHDIFGFDDDLLAMVPSPTHAVLLLFPITSTSETQRNEEATAIEKNGQPKLSENVYYTKQTIGNACGTIGVLHAVGNNLDKFTIEPNSYFSKFFENTKAMSPDERAKYLESDDSLETAHESAVAAGETDCPTIDEQINLHFVALVEVDGGLYELDGRKKTPIYHGTTTSETLLKDSVPVIQKFIASAEGSVKFNAIALAPGGGW